MPSATMLATLRAQLEDERASLRHQLAELVGSGESGFSYDENFADSGQVAAEQGETKLLANSMKEQLKEVERALATMDSGEYGRCETCGEDIFEPRLEAMPATR
ncbi:MAG: TraR/DksA family transcriptional regulator, partial [Acidimicrobiales bacterium]